MKEITKVVDYKTVNSANGPDDLDRQVKELLQNEWELHGNQYAINACNGFTYVCQPMVKLQSHKEMHFATVVKKTKV